MTTTWKRVDGKCAYCRQSVAKIGIKSGKLVVDEYYAAWGCWQKVPGKSEMQVVCSVCQKKKAKEIPRKQRQEASKSKKKPRQSY